MQQHKKMPIPQSKRFQAHSFAFESAVFLKRNMDKRGWQNSVWFELSIWSCDSWKVPYVGRDDACSCPCLYKALNPCRVSRVRSSPPKQQQHNRASGSSIASCRQPPSLIHLSWCKSSPQSSPCFFTLCAATTTTHTHTHNPPHHQVTSLHTGSKTGRRQRPRLLVLECPRVCLCVRDRERDSSIWRRSGKAVE